MKRAAGGFSLLELMTVVAVMGILAAIAFPSFNYLGANTKVKSASTDLYLAFLRARSEAVKRNATVSLQAVSGNWNNGWQVMADTDNDGTYDKVVYDVAAPKGVTVTVRQPSGMTSIVFTTSGRIQGTVPILQVASPKFAAVTRCLSAELTGRPYVKESAC